MKHIGQHGDQAFPWSIGRTFEREEPETYTEQSSLKFQNLPETDSGGGGKGGRKAGDANAGRFERPVWGLPRALGFIRNSFPGYDQKFPWDRPRPVGGMNLAPFPRRVVRQTPSPAGWWGKQQCIEPRRQVASSHNSLCRSVPENPRFGGRRLTPPSADRAIARPGKSPGSALLPGGLFRKVDHPLPIGIHGCGGRLTADSWVCSWWPHAETEIGWLTPVGEVVRALVRPAGVVGNLVVVVSPCLRKELLRPAIHWRPPIRYRHRWVEENSWSRSALPKTSGVRW